MRVRSQARSAGAILVVALGVVASGAWAQTAPPETPPETRGVTLSEQQAAKTRHSQASAGPGGPLLILSEVVTGAVVGGMIGAAHGEQSNPSRTAYLGALSGMLLLGGAAGVYQYYVPVGLTTSMLSALGALVGTLAAAGIYLAATEVTPGPELAWLMALGSQVGAAGPLIATLGLDDVSPGDASTVAAASIYGLVGAFLGVLIVSGGVSPGGEAILIAPAVGMAAGGFLASVTEPQPGRVLTLTAVPLGVGVILWYAGALAQLQDLRLQAATSLGAIGVAFALTYLFTSGPPPATTPRRADGILPGMSPTAVVLRAGKGGRDLAVGPGVRLSF